MKKICIILLCGLCDLYAQAIIKFDNTCIDIEYKLKEIEAIVGAPAEIAEIPFYHNSDWDTICYMYPNLEIYSYRITGAPYKIKVSNGDFELRMNEITIKSGESKAAVEKKLGNVTSEGNDMYLYYFPYQMQAYLSFSDDILTSATIEYVPMD